jgi:iron complex outermembrane receptor protein
MMWAEQCAPMLKTATAPVWSLDGKVKITTQLNWGVTATLSTNKIKNYHQFFSNYDDGSLVEETFAKTDIAYSPSLTGSSVISYSP